MKFELPTELSSIIKVIGVGGGGSNAVNHMHAQGIPGVDFIICNTDKQALDISRIPVKLQIGAAHTEGLGAGAKPERGALAAQENIDDIRQLLSTRTKMIFITAGMGGGTGTGAAPVIARVARDMGILTVGIVTMPFEWEGRRRKLQATAGVDELRQAVDTLLVINNDRLRDLYGNLEVDEAFAHADNVLSTAARGIADIINTTGKVNVDFEDVRTVMSDSGVAIMGMAEAEGENRAIRAAQEALNSPLLNDSDIRGAKFVLLNIALGGKKMQMDEMTEITDHIQDAACDRDRDGVQPQPAGPATHYRTQGNAVGRTHAHHDHRAHLQPAGRRPRGRGPARGRSEERRLRAEDRGTGPCARNEVGAERPGKRCPH